MTAIAKKLQATPMAPYFNLLQGMSREDKKTVIMFLTESLAETKEDDKPSDIVTKVRQKYDMPESTDTKWFRRHSVGHGWDSAEAWNRLTDKQREEAMTKLHLSPEDMDERTFGIIEKHLR